MEISLALLSPWKPISRVGGCFWLFAYALFLVYAWRDTTSFLFPDFANLMIHEAGHMFFSWGGHTVMLLGGTLGELIVPLACAAAFFFQRQIYGFAFCLFWFFENFLYFGTYMADARTASLPLINSDESDWMLLFGQWNILLYDQKIGHFFRLLGWAGMLAIMVWLAHQTFRSTHPELRPLQM